MAPDAKIYLDFSADLRAWLGEQDVSLEEILAQEGVVVEVRRAALPPEQPGERTRDLVPIILASSVAAVSLATAVAMITSAISRYLEKKAARPRYIEYLEETPVLDADGNPIVGADGKLQTIRVPVHRFVEPENLSTDSLTVEAGLEKGIVVRFETAKQG